MWWYIERTGVKVRTYSGEIVNFKSAGSVHLGWNLQSGPKQTLSYVKKN